jgi:hypothetical protein
MKEKMNSKICKGCNKIKTIEEFSKSNRKDGLQTQCKECNKQYRNIYKKEIKLKMQNYYQKNKDGLSKQKKNYYQNNKTKLKEKMRIYYINHKSKLNEKMKEYHIKNKKIINNRQNKYCSNKLKTDINFKIKHYLRRRLNNALRGRSKSAKTIQLLGCNIDQLKNHLESQFTEGMSWLNYGKWHIDHIKPCASFDLSKPKEQRKCFNYINLQPLWAEDNLRKNKYV